MTVVRCDCGATPGEVSYAAKIDLEFLPADIQAPHNDICTGSRAGSRLWFGNMYSSQTIKDKNMSKVTDGCYFKL